MISARTERRALLLAIRECYADLIFAGTKRYELRRIKPKVSRETMVFVYVPSPRMELVGFFEVAEVLVGPPIQLWRRIGPESGVSKADFLGYFDGAEEACAISVMKPRRLRTTISLDELRDMWPGFHPPQLYRYLDEEATQDVLTVGVI